MTQTVCQHSQNEPAKQLPTLYFTFFIFQDISKDIYDMDDYGLVKVRFSKGFVFACVQAANEFEDQRTRFFNENEIRDDYMEVGSLWD